MSGAWARGSVPVTLQCAGLQCAGVNAASLLMNSRPKKAPAVGGKCSTTATEGGGAHPITRPLFDYYLVMDFEATCEEGLKLSDQEIIEFPAVLVDAQHLTVVSEFQRYVRPVRRPKLSAFCTNLTGIRQEQVDGAKTFTEVYREFFEWLKLGNLGAASPSKSFAVVTCGDWDFKTMLPLQLGLVKSELSDVIASSSIPAHLIDPTGRPLFFTRWINLKHVLSRHAKVLSSGTSSRAPRGMDEMMKWFNLPLVGRHHSGIDDSRNIAACAVAAMKLIGPLNFTWEGTNAATPKFLGKGNHPPPPRSVVDAEPKAAWDGNMSGTAASSNDTRVAGAKAPRQVAEGCGFGPYLTLDANRPDVAAEMVQQGAVDAKRIASISPQEKTAMSKKVSWLLRHGALAEGLAMSRNGFVNVDTLLTHKNLGKKCTVGFLAEVVARNDKQRFLLGYGADDGQLYIRANQGHSIEGVEVDMKRILDPSEVPTAVHGTYYHAWQQIREGGLNKMGRQHIHFAKGLPGDQQVISGMRTSCQVLVYINVPLMLEDGIPLFLSENNVLLSPGSGDTGAIAPKYFLSVIDVKTGAKLL